MGIYFQMYYKEYIYASCGNKIIRKRPESNKWENYLIVDYLSVLNYSDLYNRALRHGVNNFYKIDDEIDGLILRKKALFYKNKRLINTLKIENGSKPLRHGVVFFQNKFIFGEYYNNKSEKPVHLYEYDFVHNIQKAIYTFTGIKHIHFVQPKIDDKNVLYIGTGDSDTESGIFCFDLTTHIMEKVGGGSQIWRAVSILQKDHYLIWGMDSPEEQPYIIRYDTRNGAIEKLRKIEGPAYYSVMNRRGDMFIATTVEDRKNHRAVIYQSSDGGNEWYERERFRKDVFHLKYFGFGKIEFINNQEEIDDLYFNLKGLRRVPRGA